MELPASILGIVNELASSHGDDINRAIEEAEARVRLLPEFDDLVAGLVTSAITTAIYHARHRLNVAMRKSNGHYAQPNSVDVAVSKDVQRIEASVFSYFIAGRTLGAITGEELPTIAASERQRASGHEFNARLCEELAKHVKGDKCVRDCVTERKIKSLFKRLSGPDETTAAA